MNRKARRYSPPWRRNVAARRQRRPLLARRNTLGHCLLDCRRGACTIHTYRKGIVEARGSVATRHKPRDDPQSRSLPRARVFCALAEERESNEVANARKGLISNRPIQSARRGRGRDIIQTLRGSYHMVNQFSRRLSRLSRQNFAPSHRSASSIAVTRSCHSTQRNFASQEFCRQECGFRQNSAATRPISLNPQLPLSRGYARLA
jgi:hypothetical protein